MAKQPLRIVTFGDLPAGGIARTGQGRPFAAGADISDLQNRTAQDLQQTNGFAEWQRFAACRSPEVAAANGCPLGGGCELAWMCDNFIAGVCARFGQPEIGLGVIPCRGGPQNLVHLIGRVKAMAMIRTGRQIDAAEAVQIGLIARLVPDTRLQGLGAGFAAQIAALAAVPHALPVRR